MGVSQVVTGTILAAVTGSVLGAPPAFHTEVVGDNPALWYRFDEAAGGSTAANSGSLGSAYDLTLFNGVTLGATTLGGDTGALFDRSLQQWAESGAVAPSSLTGNPSFTCEVIINIDEASGGTNYAPFLYWGDNGTMNSVYFSIQRNRSDVAYAGFYNGGLRANCPYQDEGWLHIVWTRDSAGGANGSLSGTRLWINGLEVDLTPDTQLCCSSDGFTPNVQPTAFRVQRAGDFTRYLTARFDELVLYERVLTEQEIQDHYATLGFVDTVDCSADTNGDCIVTPADFNAWIAAFNAQSPACDQNGDGICNPSDFNAWIINFNAGCD